MAGVAEFSAAKCVSIVTFGKTGSGKTSLASDIAKKEKNGASGWKPGTRLAEPDCFTVGQVEVKVYDTCGTMEPGTWTNVKDDQTVALVSDIIKNNSNGVLIVCIDMNERVDQSTMQSLALLHDRVGCFFWNRVIIALTKADRYEEHKWLKSKSFTTSTSKFLTDKFAQEVKEREGLVKEFFTTPLDKNGLLGMTKDQFKQLKIPILPTSQLDERATERMKQVGYNHWFSQLLIKCCQREQGSGLLQIHKGRLSTLPPELVEELQQEIEEKSKLRADRTIISGQLRRAKNKAISLLGIWNLYYNQVHTWDRFEEAK